MSYRLGRLLLSCYLLLLLSSVHDVTAKNCKYEPEKVEEGRACRKKCNDDGDCRGSKKRCICDNVCGFSCFNPDAECDYPTIENGDVKFENLTYDSVIQYVCNEGYRLEGRAKRTCLSSRKWSGSLPTCIKKDCDYPPRVSSAYPNAAKGFFNKDDIVTYSCRYGYIMSGNPNVTCQQGGSWTARNFRCDKLSCGDPGAPINGFFEAEDFLFGTWAIYKCKEGYELSNPRQNRRLCSSTGSWSGSIPSCTIKTCPAPDDPDNGNAVALRFEFRSVVKYTCNQGYKLEGNDQGSCNDNGDWGLVPVCTVDINCNFDSSSRPLCGYTDTGSVKWERKYLREGTQSGLPSYVISFSPTLTGKSAILSSPTIPSARPHCLQFYYRLGGQIQSNEDFSVEVKGKDILYVGQSRKKWPVGRWVGFQITIQSKNEEDLKFEIVAKGSKLIEIDELNVVKNECESKCSDPNPCQNNGVCLDEINTFSCACSDSFTGKFCEKEIMCDKPKKLEFGTITGVEKVKYGEKINFDCDQGYELRGAPSAQCQSGGTWSDEVPTCIKTIVHEGTCPTNYKSHGIMCYRFYTTPTQYEAAKDKCKREGGRLATIQSRGVESFIWNKLPSGYRAENLYWLGLTLQDWQRIWSTGLKFEEVPQLTYNLHDPRPNHCGAYHYRGRGLRNPKWEMVWRPCTNPHMFICEQWSKEASSYLVNAPIQSLDGIYKPIAGIMYEDRQVYALTRDSEGAIESYHLFYSYNANSSYGWSLGRFSIRRTEPLSSWFSSTSDASHPDKITGKWSYDRDRSYEVKITKNVMWSQWSTWSSCPVTCGEGEEYRTRECTGGYTLGSLECRGKAKERRSCKSIECGAWLRIGNIKYEMVNDRKTREEAVEHCEVLGGQLAIVKSKTLTDILRQWLKEEIEKQNIKWPEDYYINIKRVPQTKHLWEHGDKERFRTSDVEDGVWMKRQPDDNDYYNRPEDCIEISPGGWNDIVCKARIRSLCQVIVNTVSPSTSTTHPSPSTTQPSSFKTTTEATTPKRFRERACNSNPCQSRGVCSEKDNSYVCECEAGFTGNSCEIKTTTSQPTTSSMRPKSCTENFCNGNGRCKIGDKPGDKPVCFCSPGFSGNNCELVQPCRWRDITGNVEVKQLDGSDISGEKVSKGSKLQLSCTDVSQVVLGENVITCEGGKKWSRNTRITCSTMDELCTLKQIPEEFDVYDASDTQLQSVPVHVASGDSIRFQCKTPGITAKISITCVGNEWNNYIPSNCEQKTTCPKLLKVQNGKFDVIKKSGNHQTPPYLPGDTVGFSCNSFYARIGPRDINCLPSGQWSSDAPTCKDVGCLFFTTELKSGVNVRNFDGKRQMDKGTRLLIYCENGKEQEIVCEGKDTWKPSYKDFTC